MLDRNRKILTLLLILAVAGAGFGIVALNFQHEQGDGKARHTKSDGEEKMRGSLGVFLKETLVSTQFQEVKKTKLIVSEVLNDGAADEAGVAVDDLIETINHVPTATIDGLKTQMQSWRAGDEIILVVIRNGRHIELRATLQSPNAMNHQSN